MVGARPLPPRGGGRRPKVVLRQLIDEQRAASALDRLLFLPVVVARSHPLIAAAWTFRANLIVHDALYVVLVRILDAPLLTGDRKVAGAPNLPVSVLHLS